MFTLQALKISSPKIIKLFQTVRTNSIHDCNKEHRSQQPEVPGGLPSSPIPQIDFRSNDIR